MKKIIKLISIVLFTFAMANCSKNSVSKLSTNSKYLHANNFSFALYDGTKLTGDFQGIENNHFYILNNRTLYVVRKSAIRNIKNSSNISITKQLLKFEHILDIQWEKVNTTINLSNRSKKKKSKLVYPQNLTADTNYNNDIVLVWENKNIKRENSKFFIGSRIDRRIGTDNWELAIATLSKMDTTWIDTNAPENKLVFYRISSLHDKPITVLEKINSLSNTDSSIRWNDGLILIKPQKIIFKENKEEAEIDYEFYFSPYEISNADYCSMLNFAYPRDYLSGNFFDNVTVKNSLGTSKELLDLDDKDCKIYFHKKQFRVIDGFENFPVTEVTWYGAAFYCNIFSEYAGQFSNFESLYNLKTWTCDYYGKNGYRLPSELEWESAFYGNDILAFDYSKNQKLSKVDDTVFKKTNTGIFNMIGNSSEWLDDFFHYSSPFSKNFINTKPSSFKVVKGGSYEDEFIGKVLRRKNIPKESSKSIGFRIVKNLSNRTQKYKIPIKSKPVFMWEDLRFKNFDN